MPILKAALLGKIAFWLVLIGVVALNTANPAWPEWLARMVFSTGIALGVTTLGVALRDKRRGLPASEQEEKKKG